MDAPITWPKHWRDHYDGLKQVRRERVEAARKADPKGVAEYERLQNERLTRPTAA